MQDISEWLAKHNLGEHGQAFTDNGITLDLLQELTQDDLKEIGLTLGDRKRFLIAVRKTVAGAQPQDQSAQTAFGHSTSSPDSIDALSATAAAHSANTVEANRQATELAQRQPQNSDTDAPGAERRQLTVMFVDLVGSTALAERLDPEDMGQVVRAYQSLVGACISANGGYISRYMGDGVLAYFGWPAASEDDATHAVQSALAITSGISALKTPDGDLLSCRCGIATGLVVVGELIGEGPSKEHAVVGETPNLAARLQGLAAENSTVISDATRRLVGNHFEFQPLGLQKLKGIRDQVPVFTVVKAQSLESRFHASRQDLASPLIGRQRQLEQLRFYWQQSISGHRSSVLLQGEAGIGKSRLLHAFIDSLQHGVFRRVILQCDPLRTDSALYPATRFVNRLADINATDTQSVRLEKLRVITDSLPVVEVADLASDALPLLGGLLSLEPADEESHLSNYSAEQVKVLTLHALVLLMCSSYSGNSVNNSRNAAVEQAVEQAVDSTGNHTPIEHPSLPVLVVLEDAHWIDPTTIELLGVLSKNDLPGDVMLLITSRPEFEPAALPFEDLSTLQLPRLGADACREVVSSVTGGRDLPEHILNEIVAKTDGVPLFAEELTKTVIESEALGTSLSKNAARPGAQRLEIPSSLHDSLMSRLDRLQSPREVAQTAACIGREFNFELLLAISPVDEAGLRESLQTLVKAGLIFGDEGAYSFKHALVRDTAYESLLKSRRQKIHLQIGRALQKSFSELLVSQPELAGYHFRRGGSYIDASGYWHRAAKLALQRVANQEAIAHASNGLECLKLANDPTIVKTPGLEKKPDSEDALASLDNSGEHATREYELLFARGMGYMAVHGYAAETVSSNFTAALELASALEDNERYSQAARGVVTAHIVSSRFDAGLALADAMLERAETDMQRFYALRMQGQIYLWQARFDDSRRCFEQAIELYDSSYQSPLSQWDDGVLCTGFLGITLTCLGHTDRGEELHQQSVEMANRLNQPFSQCQAMESWITSILLRGDDFSTQLKTFAELADTHKMVFFQACAQMYSGIQQIRSDAIDRGIKVLTEGLSLYQACQSKLGVPKWMTYVAEGYQYAGQHNKSLQLLDDARSEMDSMGNDYFRAEWARVRAESLAVVAVEQRGSEEMFEQAIRLSKEQGARLFELTATAALVRHQRRQGRKDIADGQLRKISDQFSDQRVFRHIADATDILDQNDQMAPIS